MAAEERERGITDGLDLGPVGALAEAEGIRNSKFFGEWLNRLVVGRDMHVIITASSETGVGKTTLAASLAILLDQQGWRAEKATVADAREYSRMYDEVEPGSVLILDEAEKAVDSRRGMTTESVDLTQAFAAKRYRQVFGMMTAPTKGWVDKRLGADAADYWIQAQQTDLGRVKGEAIVYRLKTNEHYEKDYTKRTEMIHWPKMEWHTEFQRLDRIKRELLEGTEDSPYVHKDDVEDIKKSVRRETKQETVQEVIERMSDSDIEQDKKAQSGFRQSEISAAVDLSQGRISQRLNSD